MPGIVGLITRMPRERAKAELGRMLATLRHETFYTTGTWIDESLGVYVGWAAHQGSFADGMPLRNEAGNLVLIFSGEEFPEPGTVRRLRERGHDVDAGPDYLVHIAEDDPAFPAGLNGRFHGLLVDQEQRTVSLFTDRYGMQRLCVHQSKDAFYFAGEAKAILAVRPELRRLDPRGFGELLSCGCVLGNRTVFTGIDVVPGGARWSLRAGGVERKDSYFQPAEWEEQTPLGPQAYYEAIRSAFTRQLPRYFDSTQPIAMSLTGGLDTRMIMAWQQRAPGSLPCYSFGGMIRDCEDVRLARRIAAKTSQPYQVISAGPAFLSDFARYAGRTIYLTDGEVDVSLCPDLHIYERSRELGPVRMTGNYGGEVLRGVRAFKPARSLPDVFDRELLDRGVDARATYAEAIRTPPLSFAVFRQAPWFHHGSMALEQSQLASRTPYLDNDLVRTVFRAPESETIGREVCLRLIGEGDPRLAELPTDRGVGGRGGRLVEAARRTTLEFLFKAEYAYDYGMPQWLARADHALAPLRLERLFLGRHKFYHFRTWYRDALAGYLRDTLLAKSALTRPYVDAKKVAAIVDEHVAGRRNHTVAIHKLLTFELVHQIFVDARSRAAGTPSADIRSIAS